MEEKTGVIEKFKAPQIPNVVKLRPRNKKQKILSEDEYVNKMEEIIERDFFPELDSLRIQREYLDALEQNDFDTLKRLYTKYGASGMIPSSQRIDSPATFETPKTINKDDKHFSEPNEVKNENSKISGDSEAKLSDDQDQKKKVSLDAFLSQHTSEDNASFEDIREEEKKIHKLVTHTWMYKEEDRTSQATKKQQLELPSIEVQANPGEKPLQLENWTYKNKNTVFYYPDGSSLTAEEEISRAKKSKVILHENTNISSDIFEKSQHGEMIKDVAKRQSRVLEGKYGPDGKELVGGSTPVVKGYKFMKSPSPRPGVEESPLMTWGEVEQTPFHIPSGSGTPSLSNVPSFKIQKTPKRDRLALELAEKAASQHRDRKKKSVKAMKYHMPGTPRPGSGIRERMATMSPAAQRLLSDKLGIRSSTDKELTASYDTPTPFRRKSTTLLRRKSTTPITSSKNPGNSSISVTAQKQSQKVDFTNLTDDLNLNLPTVKNSMRKTSWNTAADFF